MDLTYRLEPELGADEFIDLLVRSTLAERRPVDDPETIRGMLRHADLILTARVEGRLVGRLPGDHRLQLLHLPVRPGRGRGVPAAGHRPGTDPPHPRGGRAPDHADPARPPKAGLLPHVGMTKHDSWILPRRERSTVGRPEDAEAPRETDP